MQKYEMGQLTDELDPVRIAEYEGKIAELERNVGQLTMEVDKSNLIQTALQPREAH